MLVDMNSTNKTEPLGRFKNCPLVPLLVALKDIFLRHPVLPLSLLFYFLDLKTKPI